MSSPPTFPTLNHWKCLVKCDLLCVMVFGRGSANGLNFTMFIRRNLYELLYRVIYEHRYLHYNNQGSQKRTIVYI